MINQKNYNWEKVKGLFWKSSYLSLYMIFWILVFLLENTFVCLPYLLFTLQERHQIFVWKCHTCWTLFMFCTFKILFVNINVIFAFNSFNCICITIANKANKRMKIQNKRGSQFKVICWVTMVVQVRILVNHYCLSLLSLSFVQNTYFEHLLRQNIANYR